MLTDSRSPQKNVLRQAINLLQIERRFVVLDVALLISVALTAWSDATIFFFHMVFLLLTFGAFYWKFHAFVVRAAIGVTAASLAVTLAILGGKLQAAEFVEIPMLVMISVLVFVIARHRARAEEATHTALDEARQRHAEVSALLEGSRAVLAYPEFEEAARSIFDSCKRLMGANAGYVALLTEDGMQNEVLFVDTGRAECNVDPAMPMPIRGLREAVYRGGEPIYENHFPNSQWTQLVPEGHAGLDNVLFAPLKVKGISVGLLGLANKTGGFTDGDARMASAFAELASIALLNSRTLASLQSSEERFRSVAQTAREPIITIDSQAQVVFWNQAATTIFGYSLDEAIGQPITFIMPERFRAAHRKGVGRVASGGESRILGKTVEMVGLSKDGCEFPVELSLATWKLKDEVFFTGIVKDISERKRAEEALRAAHDELELRVQERTAALEMANRELQAEIAQRQQAQETLRESEERYRRLVELVFEAIAIHSQGKLVYVNPAAVQLLGASGPEALVGQPFRDFIHPNYWELVQARLQQIGEEGQGAPLAEEKFIRLDGTVVDVEVATVPIVYQGQPAVQTVIRDISARKQAELEREQERARIARDLHDSLGHMLGFLHLKLDGLTGEVSSPQMAGVRQELVKMREVAQEAYQIVRGMLAALLPSGSGDLTSLLLAQGRSVGSRSKFGFQLTSEGKARRLPPVVQQQLVYLLQEALVNIERHANAHRAEMDLVWEDECLSITLIDDGRGFDLDQVRPDEHFGLVIMQERAREMNAQLSLSSRPGDGTRILLRVPLQPVSSAAYLASPEGGA